MIIQFDMEWYEMVMNGMEMKWSEMKVMWNGDELIVNDGYVCMSVFEYIYVCMRRCEMWVCVYVCFGDKFLGDFVYEWSYPWPWP